MLSDSYRYIKHWVAERLRHIVYRIKFGRFEYLGDNVRISFNVKIEDAETIRIADNTTIKDYCLIKSSNSGYIHIGKDCYIDRFTVLICAEGYIEIGDRVQLGSANFITGQGGLKIGDAALFAPGISVIANQHTFDDPEIPVRDQPERSQGIIIGKNGWIGVGATILDGVSVGDNVVIGANAVVNKDVPARTVAAGVPARIIKEIK
ncbi:MAG: DapH/DapD/GlmU-related protein [Armatimonadota bacterium]